MSYPARAEGLVNMIKVITKPLGLKDSLTDGQAVKINESISQEEVEIGKECVLVV